MVCSASMSLVQAKHSISTTCKIAVAGIAMGSVAMTLYGLVGIIRGKICRLVGEGQTVGLEDVPITKCMPLSSWTPWDVQ